MTILLTLICGGLLIWAIVVGQKALAKQREEHARKDAEIDARAKVALAAQEQRKIDAKAEYDAIVLPRRERWAAYEAEIERLTAEARGNPPQDLHRIAWEPATHRYMVLRWWVSGGEQMTRWIMTGRDYHDYDVGDGHRIPAEEKDMLKALVAESRGLDPSNMREVRFIEIPYADRYEPPEAKARCGYRVVTDQRFDTIKAAEYWLFLELHPDEMQRGYDMDGRHVTDELVPLERPTIPGLPSLVLGSASAVVDDSDVDLTLDEEDVDVFVGGRFIPSHLRSRNRPSSRYRKLS